MPSPSIESTRIQPLNDKEMRPGQYVLYWMQASQRAEDNHALAYAVELANHLKQPVVVVFGLTEDYPEANQRHYTFMLEGLQETQQALKRLGIKMVLQIGDPPAVAIQNAKRASAIVCDRGYLRHQRQWRRTVAEEAECRVIQVESDVAVPVSVVSDKAEYAARTIRPKIHKHLDAYLVEVPRLKPDHPSFDVNIKGTAVSPMDSLLKKLKIDTSVAPVSRFFQGGTSRAKDRLKRFIARRLPRYDGNSNQPQTDDVSHMSLYLHFGHISPVYIALKIESAGEDQKAGIDAYLEQLIVRRELAINFVHFTSDYDSFDCIPGWARLTLDEHAKDKRNPVYSPDILEASGTHDPYWNAAMSEMRCTGFMHNHMRMYWGKKILQWSPSPQEAFQTTLKLNNKYFIDGRDPNSYTGVAWIYGVHDRAWQERPIFGKTRYMAASGLERKCDINAYVKKVERLCRLR